MLDTVHYLAQLYSSVSVTFTNHHTAPTHVRSFCMGAIPHTSQCTRTHATHNVKRYASWVNESVISDKTGERVSQLQDELLTPHSSAFLQSWQSLNWPRNSLTFTEPEDYSVHNFHQWTPLHQRHLVKHHILLLQGIQVNPLNPELNPICYLLALLGAHHFFHVRRIRVKLFTFRLLMAYIYIYIYIYIWSTHSWCF